MSRTPNAEMPGESVERWKDPASGRELIVAMEFKIVDGRVAPTAISIRSPEGRPVAMTASIVRRIPIGAMIVEYLQRSRKGLNRVAGDRTVKRSTRAKAKALADIHGPHRGRPLSPDELQTVSEVYRSAFQYGVPVQQAVADHFNIPKSTAAKRIGLARAAGYLGPANGRQAGEKTATIKKGRAR